MKHPIGTSANGQSVYVDLVKSKAALRISRQPYLLGLIEEALRQMELSGAQPSLEFDMKRAIGYDFIVGTGESADGDGVFYAQLQRDDVYTRFVKNGKPQPARHLTLLLQRDDEGAYELLDTWIGRIVPPRPGSQDENRQSRTYWATHALIRDDQPIQTRTLTKTCPY